jgi:DNA-binding MarR family transcriptional regulator
MKQSSQRDVARQAWELMFDYLMRTGPQRSAALGRRGLTPNDARALWSLLEEKGKPIGALAKSWDCDPSNVTFIIDRLVRSGLAKREEAPSDRRLKLVRLTPEGAKTKRDLLQEYLSPPADLAALPREDLELLVRLLQGLGPKRDWVATH